MPTPLVINSKAAKTLTPYNRITPAKESRVIAMKQAGACSVEILESLGVPAHVVTRIWRKYREANPSQPVMPKNHNTRRGSWK
jgi:hypothetical protein